MHRGALCGPVLYLAAVVLVAPAQVKQPAAGAPSFEARQVLYGARQVPLAPGLGLSIYGKNLGPATGCAGEADPQRRETPNPLRPNQTDLETRIYPTELCETQVFIAGVPAGLLYVQAGQINFKTPQGIPTQGRVEIRVVYKGQSSAPVMLPAGIAITTASLEQPARVGGPVWLKVTLPYDFDSSIQYPFMIFPAAFGCNQIEVRRDGRLLPRIANFGSQAFGGIAGVGNPCGFLGLPGERDFKGRFPLHLQYRFDQPGTYEVRFTQRRGLGGGEAVASTDWAPIEVLPENAGERRRWLKEQSAHAPTGTVDLLTDYLPGILGIPDEQSLLILREYLYHQDSLVRQYAMYGLTYWPAQQAAESVLELLDAKGPSDAVVDFLVHTWDFTAAHADQIVETSIPYLDSDSAVLMRGAVRAISRIALAKDSPVSARVRARAGEALSRAEEHIIRADPQTVIDYAAALGLLQDRRSHDVLWNLVNRGVASGQAMIALCWRKAPADLRRLTRMALQPARGRNLDSELSSLPAALHAAYGDAALPYLESMLERSEYTWVRTNSARELMAAGRPSGFAFVVDAMEKGRPYSREMVNFVREQFPEIRQADDATVLRFVKARAAAQ